MLVSLVMLAAASRPAPTNFLIILADDVGSGDMGWSCGTANKSACPTTPVIDALAASASSAVFTRFYAGAGVCSPTRSSVLTGRNNKRSCIDGALGCDHMDPAWDCSMGPGIARTEFTIANAAKGAAANYVSQHLGKWHLGDFWNKRDPSSKVGFANPGTMGFDEWHSTEAQTSTSAPNCGCFPPPGWTPPNPAPSFPTLPPKEFPHTSPGENCIVGGGIRVNESFECANYWTANASDSLGRGATNLTTKLEGDDGDYIVAQFTDFVARAVASGKPFLSTLWMHYIHLPHPAMPSYYAGAVASGDPDYVGALEQWDATMGRVMGVLAEHGVGNDTLVWITSDNGPHCTESPAYCGGPIGHGRSNGGLRGCKASIWDGGITVPGIIHWPGGIDGHRTIGVPAVTHDILPTIMDYLNVSSPHPAWPLDGISLRPYLGPRDTVPAARSKPIGFWWGSSAAWIDNDMKLIDTGPGSKVGDGQGCVAMPPYDQKGNAAVSPMMFNLTADRTESKDLKAADPALFQKMRGQLDAWKASVQHSMSNEAMCGGGPRPAPPAPPAPPGPPGACTFASDTCGFGSDAWKKHGVATKEACCALCVADPKCTAAVYTRKGDCHGKEKETNAGRHCKGEWTCRARQPTNPDAMAGVLG